MYSLSSYLAHIRAIAAAGPAYVNGGLSRTKLDCVGLLMLAMKELGRKDYPMHSSNYFYRYQVDDLMQITGEGDVYLGMTLFKTRAASESGYDLSETYISGRYDTGDYLDAYHVGVVTGVHPLEITECTSTGMDSGIKVTSSLGKPNSGGWDCGGRQKGVNYDDYEDEEVTIMELTGKTCTVKDGSLNLRKSASKAGTRIIQIPEGESVYCYSDDGTWAKVKYDANDTSYVGYVMSAYLEEAEDQDGDEGTGETAETDAGTITLNLTAAEVAAVKSIYAKL